MMNTYHKYLSIKEEIRRFIDSAVIGHNKMCNPQLNGYAYWVKHNLEDQTHKI